MLTPENIFIKCTQEEYDEHFSKEEENNSKNAEVTAKYTKPADSTIDKKV